MTLACFHQHRLTCIDIWNAKRVLIDGSKGIFKFGILGNTEHGLLSLFGFLCPAMRELGFFQPGRGAFTTRMFVSLGLAPGYHLSLSWEVWLFPTSGHWEPLNSVEMIGISTNTNVSIFLPLSNPKGRGESSLHTELPAFLIIPHQLSHLSWCLCDY